MRRGNRTQLARRAILAVLVLGWISVGLLGTYSYVKSYYETRGFPRIHRVAGVAPGRLEWVRFYSPALRRVTDYLTYLPTGYDPSRRYPVLYLLHGMPGRPLAYVRIGNADVRIDNLIREGRIPPMILVFPDGRVNGSTFSDSEWANTSAGSYESYVVDVVRHVDARFPTIPNRDARVIGGYSSGALGALNVALHHLSVFASVQVWSGPYSEWRLGVFAHAQAAQLARYSPIVYTASVRRTIAAHPVQVFLFGGRSDGDSRRIGLMAATLARAGAEVAYRSYRGGHDWQLWNAHFNQMLILAGRDVLHPPRSSVLPAARRRPAHSHRHMAAIRAQGTTARHRHHRHARHVQRVRSARLAWPKAPLGLLLALLSAAAINLGFLLQGRGLAALPHAGVRALVKAAIRSRLWLAGQGLGWAGFGAQVVAVAMAPLSLVQAFAAGGLALSVPFAALVFAHPISRRQAVAVLVIAAALASLPLGLHRGAEHLQSGWLLASIAGAAAIALAVGLARSSARRAIAAGLLYGAADAAIKAVAVHWGGGAGLLSGWTALALIGTFAGFLAFQGALRAGGAVSAISLMNVFATMVALACGLIAFGESLGADPAIVGVHLLAVASVLLCVPVLAGAHTEMAQRAGGAGAGPSRASSSQLAGGSWQRTAAGEHSGLEPGADPGASTPEHLAEMEVAGQRVGGLGGEEQQDYRERRGRRGPPATRDLAQRHAGHQPGAQPRHDYP